MHATRTGLKHRDGKPFTLFEAALAIAAEHDQTLNAQHVREQLQALQLKIHSWLPNAPSRELGPSLLQRLHDVEFQVIDDEQAKPQHALIHEVMHKRCGESLLILIVALEIAQRLNIQLQPIDFPGVILLRNLESDHLVDPRTGRNLSPSDVRTLLEQTLGPSAKMNASYLRHISADNLIERLSRQLLKRHLEQGNLMAALKDAGRILTLKNTNPDDYIARADVFRALDCPQGERHDLEHALILCAERKMQLQLAQRLYKLPKTSLLH